MAKKTPFIRLREDLLKAAETTGALMHRSTSEQIEYWAAIGRSISSKVDPDTLDGVVSGFYSLEVKGVENVTVGFDDILSELDGERGLGVQCHRVSNSDSVRYQASSSQPGFLEQVHPDGHVVVGNFEMGEFKPR